MRSILNFSNTVILDSLEIEALSSPFPGVLENSNLVSISADKEVLSCSLQG